MQPARYLPPVPYCNCSMRDSAGAETCASSGWAKGRSAMGSNTKRSTRVQLLLQRMESVPMTKSGGIPVLFLRAAGDKSLRHGPSPGRDLVLTSTWEKHSMATQCTSKHTMIHDLLPSYSREFNRNAPYTNQESTTRGRQINHEVRFKLVTEDI